MRIFNPKIIQQLYVVSSSTYTFRDVDLQNSIKATSGSGVMTFTVPSSSVSQSGVMDYIDVFQWSAARVLFTTASTSITLRSSNGYYTRTTGSVATLINLGTDEWLLTGDLSTT